MVYYEFILIGGRKVSREKEILGQIYGALREKGYHPIGQIVGYILTEDPTYITNHKQARQMICKIDRDALLHDMVAEYFSGG